LPWVAIVALTAVVQFVRAAPVDGAVFTLMALALLADALGLVPHVGALAAPGRAPVLAGAFASCLALAFTPRHGIADGIVLVAVGVVALVGGWAGVRPRADADRDDEVRDGHHRDGTLRRTGILWAAVAVATCLWELTSFVLGRLLPEQKAQHPAISDLLDPALDQLWFRALFAAGWVALGVALLGRGGHR